MDFHGLGGISPKVPLEMSRRPNRVRHTIAKPSNEPKLAEQMDLPKIQVPPLPALPSGVPPVTLGTTNPLETAKPEKPVVRELKGNVIPASQPLPKAKSMRKLSTLNNALSGMTGSLKPKIEYGGRDAEVHQQHALFMIERYGKGIPIDPKKCVEIADQLKGMQTRDGATTTIMLRLYDVAAETHESKGNYALAFEVRGQAAAALQFNKGHPLNQLTKNIENAEKGRYGDCGLYLESGASTVPGGLALQTRPHADGLPRDVADFQICSHARGALEERISSIKKNLDTFNASLPPELGSAAISIKEGGRILGRNENKEFVPEKGFILTQDVEFHEITFQHQGQIIGSVTVCSKDDYEVLHKTVRVEVVSKQPDGEGVKKMQQMLTVLGLGPVMGKRLPGDEERLQIGLITSMYFPQVSDKVKKDKAYYDLSPADLRSKIIEMIPEQDRSNAIKIFDKYKNQSELIGKTEIVPGKEAHTLSDISTQLKQEGLHGFMSGVDHSVAAVNICDVGLLSTEMRLRMGMCSAGASPMSDLGSGGANFIFIRAVNDRLLNEPIPEKDWKKKGGKEVLHAVTGEKMIDEYHGRAEKNHEWQFSGKYQFLIQPEVINAGGHATFGDFYGVTNEKHDDYIVYQNRPDLVTFTKELGEAKDKFSTKDKVVLNKEGVPVNGDGSIQKDEMKGTLNEVGIPGGCLPPKHFVGINCISEKAKDELIQEFSRRKMIKNVKKDKEGHIVDGTLLLSGGSMKMPMNEFLHVGDQFKKEMWAKG